MPHRDGLFPSKLADLNARFETDMTILNLPAVGTTPSTATRWSVTPANLAAANKLNSNPTPVSPETTPNNLGWKELIVLHDNPATKNTVINNLVELRAEQLKTQLRKIFDDIPASALTSADRTTIHKPLHSTTHSNVPLPVNAPLIALVEQGHLYAIISITDPAHPHTAEKPAGVENTELDGAYQSREIIVQNNTARTAPPTGTTPTPVPPTFPQESDFHHIANTGKFLYKTHYTADQLGGEEIIRARYQNSRHEVSDWSAEIIITIS
ncbi:MAG: hypothetical protein ACYDEC_13580 [Bacteroidia bacterium]